MAQDIGSEGVGGRHLVRFDHYMEWCLYGPDGFYATEGTAGRRGDFITSPEVGPLFGTVLTRAIDLWWTDAGRPEPLTVLDAGCGPGTLLRAIKQAADPKWGWQLVGVDRAPNPGTAETLAAAGIGLKTELPNDLSHAIVIGNELLDNVPVRIVEAGAAPGNYSEVYVEIEDGVATEHLDILPRSWSPPMLDTENPPAGTRIPVYEQAAAWVADVLGRNPLALCLFDYGAPTTAELAARGGWLRTYREHQRGSDPYHDPGRRDITVDVGFDQLPEPSWLGRQSDFLTAWGIDDLVEEGRSYWAEHAHAPDLKAMKMRSRVTEAPALTDPDGLGGWMTAVWLRQDGRSAMPPEEERL